MGQASDEEACRLADSDLVLLDDAGIGHQNTEEIGSTPAESERQFERRLVLTHSKCDGDRGRLQPEEAAAQDPEVLRAALLREWNERRRTECLAEMQTEVMKLALDLLVREPNVEGFFGALTKEIVEETESHTCGVWLIDDSGQRCDLWMIYLKDWLYRPGKDDWDPSRPDACKRFPVEIFSRHLFEYRAGWSETVEYVCTDRRLPDEVRAFTTEMDSAMIVATPLRLGERTLGWMTVSCPGTPAPWWQGGRIAISEAAVRQAALALHHSRLVDENRREERRKATLEERNRLARDIHDNLAQGFAAILMQLQGAQREGVGSWSPAVAASIETAVDLARSHLTEARRSVGALRPNVGQGEDIGAALKRLARMGQRTASMPIDLVADELPRVGDAVEHEIISIAQEALTNAVRHSRAQRITITASTVQSVGVRLSVSDNGRGIAHDRPATGFGLTSMQERADRIGASLTIVTAPRNGTEVVLAWDPSARPTQVHAAN